MKKRKIILNLAISLDGYIADEDGGFDWIKGDGNKVLDTEKQFNFADFLNKIDILVMGRKSYEDIPLETIEDFSSKKIYVATSQKFETKYENIECINGDICKKILDLKEENGKDIWLFGGAELADHFIKADIIDEYIIGIIPIILGKGRPLFLGNNPKLKLHLNESTTQEGIVILRYTKRS
jgi:dihydrofolate reductase